MPNLFKPKGSLTVIIALMLAIVEALFFTMSECVRLYALNDVAAGYSTEAIESCFSEYNSYLWEKYHILGMDLTYGSGIYSDVGLRNRLCSFANSNSNPEGNINLLRLTAKDAKVDYVLLTDSGASHVIEQGVTALSAGLLEGIYNQNVGSIQNEEVDVREMVGDADSALDNARADAEAQRQAALDREDEYIPEIYEVDDNPIDAFRTLSEMMDYGLLYQTIPVGKDVSAVAIKESEQVSKRDIEKGTKNSNSAGMLNRTLFIQYLMTEYSNFLHDRNHDGLQYEVEYVIAGKNTDAENLADIVGKILLIREGINATAIFSDGALMGQAEAIATALCEAVLAPYLIPMVTIAVVGAWAYVESVVELRTLMSGKKISLVKNSGNWNTDVFHLSQWIGQGIEAAATENGIGYEEYLYTFLGAKAALSTEKMGLLCCDVMENAVHSQEDYMHLKMDHMIAAMDAQIEYESKQLFLSFVAFPGKRMESYEITKKDSIDYNIIQ